MENNKFEKTIFRLLRVYGVLTIIGAYFGWHGLFSREDLIVFRGKTIIGNVFMIYPREITTMIVTIILYLVFIKFMAKHISITRKSI